MISLVAQQILKYIPYGNILYINALSL